MKLTILLLFSFLSAKNLEAQDALHVPDHNAYQAGEELVYRIHYGIINAGMATFKIEDKLPSINGRPHYHIKVIGRTTGAWDYVYKVRDVYQTVIDQQTFFPSIFIRSVQEDNYRKNEHYTFRRNQNTIVSNNKEYLVPHDIHDILSVLYYARNIDLSSLKPGTEFNFSTFLDDEIFPVGATYEGKTEVSTRMGTFTCHVIKPKLIEGRIFKDQRDMTMYVSDDKNQVPIRIESAIFVGYIQADLESFSNLKYSFTSKIK